MLHLPISIMVQPNQEFVDLDTGLLQVECTQFGTRPNQKMKIVFEESCVHPSPKFLVVSY